MALSNSCLARQALVFSDRAKDARRECAAPRGMAAPRVRNFDDELLQLVLRWSEAIPSKPPKGKKATKGAKPKNKGTKGQTQPRLAPNQMAEGKLALSTIQENQPRNQRNLATKVKSKKLPILALMKWHSMKIAA